LLVELRILAPAGRLFGFNSLGFLGRALLRSGLPPSSVALYVDTEKTEFGGVARSGAF
jgi:hypothetical protein